MYIHTHIHTDIYISKYICIGMCMFVYLRYIHCVYVYCVCACVNTHTYMDTYTEANKGSECMWKLLSIC